MVTIKILFDENIRFCSSIANFVDDFRNEIFTLISLDKFTEFFSVQIISFRVD